MSKGQLKNDGDSAENQTARPKGTKMAKDKKGSIVGREQRAEGRAVT